MMKLDSFQSRTNANCLSDGDIIDDILVFHIPNDSRARRVVLITASKLGLERGGYHGVSIFGE